MCGFEPVPAAAAAPASLDRGGAISSERAFAGGGLCRKANSLFAAPCPCLLPAGCIARGGGEKKSGAVDRLTDRIDKGKEDSQPQNGTGTGAGLAGLRPRSGETLSTKTWGHFWTLRGYLYVNCTAGRGGLVGRKDHPESKEGPLEGDECCSIFPARGRGAHPICQVSGPPAQLATGARGRRFDLTVVTGDQGRDRGGEDVVVFDERELKLKLRLPQSQQSVRSVGRFGGFDFGGEGGEGGTGDGWAAGQGWQGPSVCPATTCMNHRGAARNWDWGRRGKEGRAGHGQWQWQWRATQASWASSRCSVPAAFNSRRRKCKA